MKVLKVTIEIPLTHKSHAGDIRRAGEMVEKFRGELQEAGFDPVVIDETVANRPGRG